MRILLTTTSFQDTWGPHQNLLKDSGFEIVTARGPLNEQRMLELISAGGGFDGLLPGDDVITARVIDAALPRLKVISKYGIGLDAIDVAYATGKRLPVLYTPGVNHTTVAEHTFALMLACARSLYESVAAVKAGRWERHSGVELFGKTLGVVGMGRVGKEVVKRAVAFGMKCVGYDAVWDDAFAAQHGLRRAATLADLLPWADVVTLHLSLSAETRHLISWDQFAQMRDGAILINTARGGLVDEAALEQAMTWGKVRAYGTDVLEREPPGPGQAFEKWGNVIVTPHVGSRTVESVQRQGMRAAMNLVNYLRGDPDYIQANPF